MSTWKAEDGSLINYELHGDAPDNDHLLLLPGLLGSIASQWRPYLPLLTDRFRVILMDMRGHGRSENAQKSLQPERMVSDIIGLLDSLQVDSVHVAGYSLGGYLGLWLALTQPRRVSSLLLHATKFYWTKDAVDGMKIQLDPDRMAEKVPTYANQLSAEHGPMQWRRLVRQAADLVAWLSDNGITESMAGRLQIPVIVSQGDRDELVQLPESLRLSRLLPNGNLLVLPGVRHPFVTVPAVPLIPMMREFHHGRSRRS